MKKISKYFKGVGEEVRRIRWPSKHLLWSSVLVVLSVTIVSALSILLCDLVSAKILDAFENAFNSSSDNSSAAAMLLNNLVRWVK